MNYINYFAIGNCDNNYNISLKLKIIHTVYTGVLRCQAHNINKFNHILIISKLKLVAESEQRLQRMTDKLDATCEQYAKKTKTMIVEKTPEKQCEVNVKGQRLTQVKQHKYLGTTVENTGQCKTEVANRINQAKIAFWKKATILRSNISIKTRIRVLMCYVFSVILIIIIIIIIIIRQPLCPVVGRRPQHVVSK